jgi:type I restriction enzyme S subunit
LDKVGVNMEEFITKPLGEMTSIITKGIAPKYTEQASDNTIVVLNQKCNRNYSISLEQSRLNDCSKKAVPAERILKKYDVLINSTGTGTAGRVAQLFDAEEPMTIDGHMILIRPTAEIDPIYYGYAVKAHQAEIELLAEGSTGQTEINRRRLESEVMISFPRNISSQKKIGKFLYQIDQKIKNNTAINNNLAA